mmetsp:Transcript_81786/g.210652  ORF Transcript_81786/g.210652 Transcript_81786/m.210652 type:complete len:390 (-) Transcript_81786:256-1425(-)
MSLSVVQAALEVVLVVTTDPVSDDVDQRPARDRARIAEEAPDGVCRQVVLLWDEAVDVLRRDTVHEAVAPEGHEDRDQSNHCNGEHLQAEPDDAADPCGSQEDHVHEVRLEGQRRRYSPTDSVTGEDEDGDQREEDVPVEERALAGGAQQRHHGGIVGVVVHRRHVLHHKVDNDLRHDIGQNCRQPRTAVHQRAAQACLHVAATTALLLVTGRVHLEHEHAYRDAQRNVPVKVLHRHLVGHAELAQDADRAEAERGSHDGPSLRQFPERRDHAQESALEDTQTNAGEPVRDEDGPHPLAAIGEHEKGRNDGADEHQRHGDVNTVHRREAAQENVVAKPGHELPVVHENCSLREGLRPVANLPDVQLRFELLLQRPHHGCIALEHAEHNE